jgi:tetratricopeptide (TPR) repeat protein
MVAVDGDEQDWEAAFDGLAVALDAYDDPVEALDALDALVADQLDNGLERARADISAGDEKTPWARWIRRYAALLEDFYTSVDLSFAAWNVRFHRGRLALTLDLVDEAVELLHDAAPELALTPEVYAGTPWHLLGEALNRQGRSREAANAFELAAAASTVQGEHALAAESLDELARVVEGEDPERSVELYSAAAKQWRLRGNEDEAKGSVALAGWAALEVVKSAYAAGDLGRREMYARLAYDGGSDVDEDVTALAALQLALLHTERADPAPAIELLTEALATFESNGEGEMVAYGLAMLAGAYTLAGDLASADAVLRRALAMAEQFDDQEMVAQLLGMLGASAEARFDHVAAGNLLGLAAEHVLDVDLPLAQDRQRLTALLFEGNLVEARSLAESIVERTMGTPRTRLDGLSALGILFLLLAAEGDVRTADHYVRMLEDLSESERATGESLSDSGIKWMLPLLRAFAAMARGEMQTSQRILLARHDELLHDGAGLMAARLAGVVGLIDFQTGHIWAAVDRLVPVTLALSRQLAMLPSSAERSALRTQLQNGVRPTFEAVAATGDDRLLSELIEIVRSQSIPEPPHGLDAVPSVASLLRNLFPGRGTGQVEWAEQETNLRVPPLIVMPWGSVALGQLMPSAERYIDARRATAEVRVLIVVPR